MKTASPNEPIPATVCCGNPFAPGTNLAAEIDNLWEESLMPTEHEKMLAGELYDPLDPELVAARDRARDLCQSLNATSESERDERDASCSDGFGTGR